MHVAAVLHLHERARTVGVAPDARVLGLQGLRDALQAGLRVRVRRQDLQGALGLGGWPFGGFTPLIVLGGTPLCRGLGFRFETPERGPAAGFPYAIGKDDVFETHHPYYFGGSIDERRRPFLPSLWELPERSRQTLKQVWFPGVHTNVGGGYDRDGLANSAMHWIKQSAKRHGMEFDDDFLEPYAACPGGELRDSLTLAYRVLIPAWREIGSCWPCTGRSWRSRVRRVRRW